ncbi:hypothetical protein HK405_007422 [Cladochytrium tenue]|nr:hypothetical protein HK405_007422 [Cladochytrium tenue]
MVVVWGFAALVVWFSILGVFLYGSHHKSRRLSEEKAVRVWQRRLESCCVGRDSRVARDSKDVLRDVATELADYFKDVDWAPTDLLAGLILLKREQKRITEIRQARRLVLEQPAGFSIPVIDSSETLTEIANVTLASIRRRRELASSSTIAGSAQDPVLSILELPTAPTRVIITVTECKEESHSIDTIVEIASDLQPRPSGANTPDLSDLESNVSLGSSLPSTGPLLDGKGELTAFHKLRLLQGINAPRLPATGSNEKFKPWITKKKRRIGHHRLRQKNRPGKGALLREDIDDILHFARYAEVIYDDDDVALSFPAENIIRHSPDNHLYKSPYLVVHDTLNDAVVIAVRGTYSAADILVDLKFTLASMDVPELSEQRRNGVELLVHEGMLMSAMNILKELRELNVLEPLLRDPSSKYYECGLVVTGHSLGAGVAALLAALLRPEYPAACCYAFEPPGCLVSAAVAEYLEPFCTSVVMGDDLVPRMSRNSMEMLKQDVIRQLRTCDHPKWRIFGSVLGARVCFRASRLTATKEKAERPGLLNRRTPSGKLYSTDLALLRRRTNSLRAGRSSMLAAGGGGGGIPSVLPSTPMFVPGRILFIEKFRRPPLRLNEAIGGALDLAKEKTKAVGERILDGAEKLKDGAGGIKDKIMDGAEGIKDKIMDGAGGFRDIIVDGAERILDGAEGFKERLKDGGKGRRGGGAADGESNSSQSDDDDDGVSPAYRRPRTGSSGDLRMRTRRHSARPRSMADLRLGATAAPSDGDTIDSPLGGPRRPRAATAVDQIDPALRDEATGGNIMTGDVAADDAGADAPRQARSHRRRLRSRSRSRARAVSSDRAGPAVAMASDATPEQQPSRRARSASRGPRQNRRRRNPSAHATAAAAVTAMSDREEESASDDPDAADTSVGRGGGAPRARPSVTFAAAAGTSASSTAAAAAARVARAAPRHDSAPSKLGALPEEDDQQPVVVVVVDSDPAPTPPSPLPLSTLAIPLRDPDAAASGTSAAASPSAPTPPGSPSSPEGELVLSRPQYPPSVAARRKHALERTKSIGAGGGAASSSSTAASTPEPHPPGTAGDAEKQQQQQQQQQLQPSEERQGKLSQQQQQQQHPHGKYHYIPRWASRYEFHEVVVSRSMVKDHFPFGILREVN